MNKSLFFMCAMAGALLAASCSTDEQEEVLSGNESQVSFSLALEGAIDTHTRAISDGKSADKLIYAVFDENGTRISSIAKVEKTGVSFPTTETLTLAKGKTYQVVFWAQDGDCSAYTVSDDMKVTISYGGTNNDETRDAFFKTIKFTVDGSAAIDVVMKRPFAQVNVGVTKEDWDAAVASGINVSTSTVTLKQAATSLNLLTGKAETTADVTYSAAAIPTETLSVDADDDGTDETYQWLSMCYVLVNDGSEDGTAKATLESLDFTFKPESGNDIELNLTSVPVQRNWRTNILGQLLTGNISFNIKIDPAYDGDYKYPDGSAQELAMAAAYGGVVTLTEDVALTKALYIAPGMNVELNLNGHSIMPPAGADRTIQVQDGANLTINGEGTVGSLEGGALAVSVLGGNLTINGGTYYGGSQCSCIYLFNAARYDEVQNAGSVTINGGSFKVNAPWNDFYYVLNMQNSAENQPQEGTIIVRGGTFENYNPAVGDDHDQPTNFVDEANGYFSVRTSEESATPVIYEVKDFRDVVDYMETAGGTLTISQDISIERGSYYNSANNFVLELTDGAVISANETMTQTATVRSGIKANNVTIKGDGTIMAAIDNTTPTYSAAIECGGKNVVIEGDLTVDGGSGGKSNCAVYVRTGTTTIKGGYFKVGLDKDGVANSCIYVHPSNKNMKATLNIEGGVFETEGNLNDWYPVINVYDTFRSNCTVSITGGIFINYNPAKGDNTGAEDDTFVADGYESVQINYEGKTAWKVQKAE